MEFAVSWPALWDAQSAAIVVGGTFLATILRSGLADTRTALRASLTLVRKPFDGARARADLARQVGDIRTCGVLRAEAVRFRDPAIMHFTDAMIRHRSWAAAVAEHDRHRGMRAERTRRAVATLHSGAELAPVLGLAGTLLALSSLPATGLGSDAMMATVAMAIVSTLYGLMLANFVAMPLAQAIERHAAREDAARQELFDWMGGQLAESFPAERAPTPKPPVKLAVVA